MTFAATRDNQIRLTIDIYPSFDKYPNLGTSEYIIKVMQFNCRSSQTKVEADRRVVREFFAYCRSTGEKPTIAALNKWEHSESNGWIKAL